MTKLEGIGVDVFTDRYYKEEIADIRYNYDENLNDSPVLESLENLWEEY